MRRVVVSYLFLLYLFCGTLGLSGQQPVTKLSTGGEARPSSLVFEGNQFVFQGHIDHLMLYLRVFHEVPNTSLNDLLLYKLDRVLA